MWIKYEALAVVVYEYEGRRIISVVYEASVKCIFLFPILDPSTSGGIAV